MLDGVSTALNTVVTVTPYMTTAAVLMTAGRAPTMTQGVIGGAIGAGMVAAVWEFTVNGKQHNGALKTEVISITAGIGGALGGLMSI